MLVNKIEINSVMIKMAYMNDYFITLIHSYNIITPTKFSKVSLFELLYNNIAQYHSHFLVNING